MTLLFISYIINLTGLDLRSKENFVNLKSDKLIILLIGSKLLRESSIYYQKNIFYYLLA